MREANLTLPQINDLLSEPVAHQEKSQRKVLIERLGEIFQSGLDQSKQAGHILAYLLDITFADDEERMLAFGYLKNAPPKMLDDESAKMLAEFVENIEDDHLINGC